MSSRGRFATSAAVVAVVSGLVGRVSKAALTPIALNPSSFNYNTVVTSGSIGSSATIVGGTPSAVDTENGITFWGPSYSSTGALPASGVPFTSSGNPNTQFQFNSFTANNTLLINADQKFSSNPPFYAPPYSQTGSLVLASTAQAGYSNLAVLYTAAGQDYYGDVPSIGYTLNFANGTSYNNSGTASFTGYGWGGVYGPNTPAPGSIVATTVNRVWVNTSSSNYGKQSGNSFYLYEADITVPTADVNQTLTSISFYDSGSGSYSSNTAGQDPNSLAIYALSGTPVPEPASGGLALAATAAMLLRRRNNAARYNAAINNTATNNTATNNTGKLP
jgi:hypothetical protein